MDAADLLLFQHLVRKGDCDCGLETAALMIAAAEYPALDVSRYLAKLDYLGRRARKLVAAQEDPDLLPKIVPVLRLLYQERGFRGNLTEYYDPRNSFLNQVLDRRLGIPITLAVVLIGVCRRAGVEARGVSFPGHFLVRTVDVDGEPLYVDPFDGRILDEESLHMLYEQATGQSEEIDPECLQPASCRAVLARMLNNLRAIYEVTGQSRRLKRIVSLMGALVPNEELGSWNAMSHKSGGSLPVRVGLN
ncbi:MAG: transglutaminase-like domain-containing protein [Deltaproteobacteria bacterium]|nr:transglutaminase-like domain-containing protein [Deltaproteobacteria bacterium]